VQAGQLLEAVLAPLPWFDQIAKTGELAFKAQLDTADRAKRLMHCGAFLSDSDENRRATALASAFAPRSIPSP